MSLILEENSKLYHVVIELGMQAVARDKLNLSWDAYE